MKNKIFLILACLILIHSASAEVTIVQIPYTDTESTFDISDLINTELQTDPSNVITDITVVTLDQTPECDPICWAAIPDTAPATIQMTFNNQTIYTGQKTTTNWIIFEMSWLSHSLVVGNTTIFNESNALPSLPSILKLNVMYDETTSNNTYTVFSIEKYLTSGKTNAVRSLPAQAIRIQSNVPFKISVTYENPTEMQARTEQIKGMNGLLGVIANYGDKLLPGWAMNALFPILLFMDTLFKIMELMASALYRYPYLLIIWYITFLNVYVSFKTETFSDFIVKWIQGAWVGIEWFIRSLMAMGNFRKSVV